MQNKERTECKRNTGEEEERNEEEIKIIQKNQRKDTNGLRRQKC